MKRIRLWGGFHNSPETTIVVKDEDALALEHGQAVLCQIVSPYQRKRLEKHFCGIKGCLCYSFDTRVEWEIVERIPHRRSAYQIAEDAIDQQRPIDHHWLRNVYNSMNSKERIAWAKQCLESTLDGSESKRLIGSAAKWFVFLIKHEI